MWVLQICHCYYPPFLDCARQYAVLFIGTRYKLLTVFLTGSPDPNVAMEVGYGEVVFLGYESKEVAGLKLDAINRIRQLHQQYRFQFCIAHRAKPTYVALLATPIPIISIRHNYGDFKRLSRRLVVNLFQKRLHILAVSNSVRDEIRGHLSSWPAERIQTFYNHIDVDAVQSTQVSRQEARHSLGLSQDVWIVGNVGRLHHDKDQATLIEAFARALPNLPASALLVIIGKGPLENNLKQLAADMGIQNQVKFMGQVPNAKKFFKAFDVFALTSDHEPFGMVLLEAMAAEVPIVCSDCGGGCEVVRDAGLLFPFANIEILADRLIYMAKTNLKEVVTKQNKKLLSNFTDRVAATKFQDYIN